VGDKFLNRLRKTMGETKENPKVLLDRIVKDYLDISLTTVNIF